MGLSKIFDLVSEWSTILFNLPKKSFFPLLLLYLMVGLVMVAIYMWYNYLWGG